MALSDNQLNFGGVLMGVGTPYGLLSLNGIRGDAPIQSNDTPKLLLDGVFPGYDTQLARLIDASLVIRAISAAAFESAIAALEATMVPILNGTSFLNWKLPGQVEKKIAARPRKCDIAILPTYRLLWAKADLQWSCPAPAVLNGP